jgi:hypothetical protein
MHKINLSLFVAVAGCCLLFAHVSAAGPLSSAQVTKIINRVNVVDPAKGAHSAAIREVIKDDLGLQTGARSRSELLFQDNTLTRIGAETFFSFKTGTRDLTLEKGSMLLQVPKGLGGAKIHTAAVTAAITGTTIMMEYIPRRFIKVLVLEGSLRLSRNGALGGSVILHPGNMVVMQPDAKKIPDPVDVNLALIVKTSPLVNFPGKAPLPSMPLIQAAIDGQNGQLANGHLVPTNLVVRGTNVIFASNNQLATLGRLVNASGANTSGVTGATLRPVTGALGGVVGSVTNIATSGTGAVNNLLGTSGVVGQVATNATNTVTNILSSGGVVGQATNNLLGGTLSGTAVPVSSSTQILGLLNNVTSTSGGTIVIIPTVANVVPTAVTTVVQNLPGGTGTATGIVPTVLSTVGSTPTGAILPNLPVTTNPLLPGGH